MSSSVRPSLLITVNPSRPSNPSSSTSPRTTSYGDTSLVYTPSTTPTTIAPAQTDTNRFSLIQQIPYIISIAALLVIILLLTIGWVHTFVVLKLRIHKLRGTKRNDLTASQNLLSAVELARLNSDTLPVDHDYERMKTKDTDSDYHFLEREHKKNNGGLLTQQSVASNLPPDYEYNKLEKDDRHDYHEVEVNETEDYSQLTQQSNSSDYDHLLEDPLSPPASGQRHDYHVLEGPLSATNPMTDSNYHVLEGPTRVETTTNPDRASARENNGAGIAGSNQSTVRETSFNTFPKLSSKSKEVEVSVRRETGPILESLEIPQPTSPSRAAVDRGNEHHASNDLPAPSNKTTGRENAYYILEGPLPRDTNTTIDDYDQLEESELAQSDQHKSPIVRDMLATEDDTLPKTKIVTRYTENDSVSSDSDYHELENATHLDIAYEPLSLDTEELPGETLENVDKQIL